MMSYKEAFGLAASVAGIISYLIYLDGIYRKNVRPHFFTWFLWGLLMSVVWLVQYVGHAGPGAWVTLISAGFSLLIAALTWRRGLKDITRSDWIFFILGVSSIPVWLITKQPLFAIILLIFIDYMGVFPTLRKSLARPWEEAIPTYMLVAVKHVLALFAMEQMLVVNWLYPAAMAIEGGIVVLILLIGRHMNPKSKTT